MISCGRFLRAAFNQASRYSENVPSSKWSVKQNAVFSKYPRSWSRAYTRSSTAFVDRINIVVKAGNGGSGCASFTRGPNRDVVPPDGGHGGNGGSVWIEATTQCTTLRMALGKLRAESGSAGRGAHRNGRHGNDLIIPVPAGTIIRECPLMNDEEDFEEPSLFDQADPIQIAELNKEDDRAQVARGGHGGRGNVSFKSSKNRSPVDAEPGESGETRRLELELKSIADVGLVGLPNAGKSTFLRAISDAKPRVASYPFTTLQPHIGMVQATSDDNDSEYQTLSVADIPGLIEGAHENRGLGHEFLRHIERTKFLVFVLDLSTDDGGTLHDFEVLQNELEMHEAGLSQRQSCIVANKMDTGPTSHENLNSLVRSVGDAMSIFPISAKYKTGTEPVIQHLLASVI